VQEERRYCNVVSELLESSRVFGKVRDPGGNGKEADEGEQAEHQGITRKHRGITADRVATACAQNTGQRVRIIQ
jgi:hypothetical protein